MKIGCVILCRFNSSRLPGKALRELKGKPSLAHTYDRLCQAFNPQQIIVATSEEDSDNPIVEFCKQNSIQYFRGSLDHVAERFAKAAESIQLDYAFRVNGDNIFLDLEVFQEAAQLATSNTFDFISNVKNRTYPKGMSVECVKTKHYTSLLNEIDQNSAHKEHVTLYLYENELATYRFIYNTKYPEIAGVQIALDTSEDFENISRIIDNLGDKYPNYNLEDLIRAYE